MAQPDPRLGEQRHEAPMHPGRAQSAPGLPAQLWRTRILLVAAWAVTAVATVAAPLAGAGGPWLQLALLVVLGAVTLWCERRTSRGITQAQAAHVQRLERLAAEDDLTGLANRRAFNQRLSQEFLRARRYGHPFAVVLVDLDRFKAINDTHGHAAGDRALAAFAAILRGMIRATDVAARLGGDEFALLLPETDAGAAERVVRRLKLMLAERPVPVDPATGDAVRLSVSAGVAALSADTESESKLLAAADRALYADKREDTTPRVTADCRL
jgi:diguanylate cyclase (GGDEF)-like protein